MNDLGDSTQKLPLELTRRLDELCDEFEARLQAGDTVDFAP
jgi:hypothetical protein